MERSTIFVKGKSAISMVIFNSYVTNYQRVSVFTISVVSQVKELTSDEAWLVRWIVGVPSGCVTQQFIDDVPIKMVIFHGYVLFPDVICHDFEPIVVPIELIRQLSVNESISHWNCSRFRFTKSRTLKSIQCSQEPLSTPWLSLRNWLNRRSAGPWRWFPRPLGGKTLGAVAAEKCCFLREQSENQSHQKPIKIHQNHGKSNLLPDIPGHPTISLKSCRFGPLVLVQGPTAPRMLVRTILEGSTVVMKVIPVVSGSLGKLSPWRVIFFPSYEKIAV